MAELTIAPGQNSKWMQCDLSELFDLEKVQKFVELLTSSNELSFTEDTSPPPQYDFPDFGANRLQPTALKHLCLELSSYLRRTVSPVLETPSVIILLRMGLVWERIVEACGAESYTRVNIQRVIATLQKEEQISLESSDTSKEAKEPSKASAEKKSGNEILVEMGVKTGLSVVFSLLKQAWAQLAWQKQLELTLQQSGAVVPFSSSSSGVVPVINLPNEVLKSILDIMKGFPPLSLSNKRALSSLSETCLTQSREFLESIVRPDSCVDSEGKRLAMEIMLSITLQYGDLVSLLEWVSKMLSVLGLYRGKDQGGERYTYGDDLTLSKEFCDWVLDEIRRRTHLGAADTGVHETRTFSPKQLSEDGHVHLMELLLFLCDELCAVSNHCTSFFSHGVSSTGREDGKFISESCEVLAFGSNSSSQLAMGSTEKFHKATLMTHMANVQVIEAGQYCTFLIFSDGSMKACGKGSYGRLGLGNSDSQSSLKEIGTFPPGTVIRRMASSRGSDGHSLAITNSGEVYSWGDGNYGKLGHGDNATQKIPKLINAFAGKVVRHVACGNRHSAAVTIEGDLYTWGEGDHGRLGHGNTSSVKTPTKVVSIGPVQQAACGVAHTLALGIDGLTVWSFGSGDSGKLGHGETTKQTAPKAIEALRGIMCQKVCAASQFSLVLTAGGKVYSFGNGSGVGKGTTEPRQYSPWLIEPLEGEMVIDISTGDGHCLALTQRGEVYAWGTNSMGQCGQGHSNGSIVTPSKVQGLEGVQVQQISAGTSHSMVWTAVPLNRRASAMWHWPYCVSVTERTFQILLNLLNQFGNVGEEQPTPPFHSKEVQESFLHSLLSLTRTHLGLVAPLGPSCVHMACGTQVKPLRNLLFKLVDSQLPPSLDQVASDALEVGSSVLLPPVVDRLDLLLSLLPEQPSLINTLTTGQRRQLEILLSGFSERSELVGLLVDSGLLEQSAAVKWTGSTHIKKVFALCERIVLYIKTATFSALEGTPFPAEVSLGSQLLTSFQELFLSIYINILSLLEFTLSGLEDSEQLLLSNQIHGETNAVVVHFLPFYNILKEHSMAVLEAVTQAASQAEQPQEFLLSKKDVLFGFLGFEFPQHVAFSCPSGVAFDALFHLGDLLLEMAKSVHKLVVLLPQEVIDIMENEELQWEPTNEMPEKISLTKLRPSVDHPWRKVADLERLLCFSAAKMTETAYTSTSTAIEDDEGSSGLHYCPMKTSSGGSEKTTSSVTLLSSHLLSNGVVGDEQEIAQGIYSWVSLCKTLPGDHPAREYADLEDQPDDELTVTVDSWSDYIVDFNLLAKKDRSLKTLLPLNRSATGIQPCDMKEASPLLALAAGAKGNEQAERIYDSMMDLAIYRDWNTCSDEKILPQLRQVSCAALACLLKHTGLFTYAAKTTTKPKKKLIDVYRAVFSLRREVFTNRPIPNDVGKTSPEDEQGFQRQCNAICATLMFLVCILDPALPEENEPIVPQIPTSSSPTMSSTSAEDIVVRSPGAGQTNSAKGALRLFSQPAIRDDTARDSKTSSGAPAIVHTGSLSSPDHDLQGWSLSAVKQALSHLRWQRDRLDHLHASATSLHGPDALTPHQKIISMIVDVVSLVFSLKSEKGSLDDSEDSRDAPSTKLMNRVILIRQLMGQKRRALHRRNALQRVVQFLLESESPNALLPSARLIFLSSCLNHTIHCSDHITAAPSVLQHEVKSLSHTLLENIVHRLNTADITQLNDSPVYGLKRELLLALQWLNFEHHPSDLQLLFTGSLYDNITAFSGVVSTQIPQDTLAPSSDVPSVLANRLKMASLLAMQLLTIRVGMNAEVLKSRTEMPDILFVVSNHLFGQLEGYIVNDNQSVVKKWELQGCSVDKREHLLGDYLRFINTLSATHEAIRSVLASETWFGTLLRIVDIDTSTGIPVVSSLKTRLLALQVLGGIMAELSDTSPEAQVKCAKIIEDFLELMYRCMFLAPLSLVQSYLTPQPSLHPESPLEPSQSQAHLEKMESYLETTQYSNCTSVRESSDNVVESEGSGEGFIQFQPRLTSGKYAWKVTIESANVQFRVGVAQTPIAEGANRWNSSWCIQADTGVLHHNGEPTTNTLFTLAQGDTLTLEYNASSSELNLRKNSEELKKAFNQVIASGKELSPFVQFLNSEGSRKVILHPVEYVVYPLMSHLHQREQLASGYPLLSPTNVTLIQTVVGILYQLQNKEPWSKAIGQVVTSKLSEMDILIHRLLDLEADLSSSPDHTHPTSALSLLLAQFTQVVWPSLALIGGIDTGYCLGRSCQLDDNGDQITATLAGIPDAEQKVEVQEQVTTDTARVKKRTVSLSDVRLSQQTHFSLPLILERLTPSLLLNLAHLAGYLDRQHSLPVILQRSHSKTSVETREIAKCLSYHQLCSSILQMAATKSLHTILFEESIIQLLNYQQPTMDVIIAGGYIDRSELAEAVKEVVKCLSSRAVKPSSLRLTLRMLELERVHAILSNQCLTSVADHFHKNNVPASESCKSGLLVERNEDVATQESMEDLPTQQSEESPENSPTIPPTEEGGAEANRPSTPPLMNNLMEMGFTRPQINVAMERCEIPPNSSEEVRTQLIVAWILEHPNAVSEEEARREQSRVESDSEEERRRRREEDEQQQQQQEADQTAAANEFLSMVGDMLGTCKSPTISNNEEARRDTKHAPDLLEGPDVNDEVPDVNLSGLDCSPQSLKSLLSALGLSQKRPTPKRFEFTLPDPLGSSLCKSLADLDETEGDHKTDVAPLASETDFYKMSATCNHIVDQAQKLKSLNEHLDALNRIASATQTLVARRVTMLVIASLSTQSTQAFISGLQALDLIDIKLLVRLLRLVHAGRIDGTPGSNFTVSLPSSLLPLQGLKCLGSAISTVIIENGTSAGSQLMQACSRDLLAAAVGGAELLHSRSGRRRRHRRERADKSESVPSDVSVLSNPNFSVSQSLVQTLAESTGKIVDSKSSAAVLQMIDALAACLFSSKLEPEHRFWALEQILKVFATTVDDERIEVNPEDLVIPSHLDHLTGHKGQIMVCAENKRQNCIVSIGEDNCLLLWNLVPGGPTLPEITTLPFPDVEANSLESLMLPNLTQSFNQTCIAGAVNEVVCVWRLKDGKAVTEKFPELITTLQWKPKQKEGESPLLLVGLIDGGVELVEVLRSSVNLPHELQTTKIEESARGAVCSLCWSPDSTMFAVASVTGSVQIYQGSGREYNLTNEIKETQATCMYWSPEGSFLTTLEEDGTLKLWDMKGEVPSLAHSFDAYSTNTVTWHSEVSGEGDMLLASGSKDCGVVHLWIVHAGQPTESETPVKRGLVSHVKSLEGHSAPITCLEFSESAALLASGCKAGSVRIWDLKSCSLIKYATRSVGEVVHLSWTAHGLAVCYKNTMSLCLLPPGPNFYLGERCIHNCLPALHQHAITEMEKAPCLTALLKNLHHVLLDQYQYEQAELSSSQQLVHSEYLQLLTALAVGLGLHTVLVSPPHPPHLPAPPPPKQWTWLSNFVNAVSLAESLTKRSAMPTISELSCMKDVERLHPDAKYQPTDNSAWTLSMDREILEWISKEPQDWWQKTQSTVYTWGKGSWNQLGTSTRENSSPALAEEWKDVQQVVAGSYCTYAVRFDGTVSSVGEGSYGRLGHGGSESETKMRTISALQGIPIVQLVAGSRVSTSTDEGFALALSDSGDVYSWGKGYKGRLGHSSTENVRSPKMVDALGGKDIKMITCCDYHSAAISAVGHLYTFGSKENGKLGHGRDVPSGSTGNVMHVAKFLDSDQTTDMGDVRIGYVSCGQMFTLAVTEDGRHVYGFGKSDYGAFGLRDISGDHYFPMLLNHLTPFGPFVKAVSGNRVSALLNLEGKVCHFGKLYDSMGHGLEAEFVSFPNNEKVVDLASAAQFMVALTESGNVYYWGKMQYGVESSSAQSSPKLIEALSGKGLKQVTAGVRHCAASNTTLPVRGVTNIAVPSAIPSQYSALREVPCQAIHARLLLLNHFAKMITTSWRLFSIHSRPRSESARFHINPLVDDTTRSLLSPVATESMMAGVMSRTMLIKQHGPTITVQRISQDDRACKPVLSQIANQILQKDPKDLRCHSRAWKVNLVGEGADDAGGVFDETIAQMCEEMENGTVNLLIQAPNARSKTGFNTDRYVFNPACTSTKDLKHLKFLGILLGVAMRTKKPLDLHLAQPMWKLLAGMNLTADDLEEVDLMFMRTLYSIRDVHKTDITEDDFSEMIPIEKFEAQSMNGNFVPIVPGGGNIHLTYQNRKEYVDKALLFRLHELDQQVAAIRGGMSIIVPVPLLSLYTAKMLESAVCGNEDVDLQMLKKVVRYRDGTSQEDSVVQWLWQTLESFTVEERILFLRFVSGRSRLPTRVSEIPQRFQISVASGQTSDSLPTAQTCFFQLRLPNYSSQELLAERLRYAIRHCRSIDMDTYMLRRGGSGDYYDDSDDLYDYGSD